MATRIVELIIKASDAKPVAALIAACLDLAPVLERLYDVTQTPEYQRFETAIDPFRVKPSAKQ